MREKFSEEELWHVLCQVLQGLEFLSAQGLPHLDVRPRTIFFQRDLCAENLKVYPRSLAGCRSQSQRVFQGSQHTACRLPPELFERGHRFRDGALADVWCLGLSVVQLALLKTDMGSVYDFQRRKVNWAQLLDLYLSHFSEYKFDPKKLQSVLNMPQIEIPAKLMTIKKVQELNANQMSLLRHSHVLEQKIRYERDADIFGHDWAVPGRSDAKWLSKYE